VRDWSRLVAEVGLGQVGLVMGLEVSRLARSSLDWHQLLELCSMTGTLILAEDGLYDPATFNDRLLLGMKGAMSEAELHVLRARLRGGMLNQVQRAALKLQLPVGLVYARCRYRPARSRCPGPTSLAHPVCHRSLGQDQPGQRSNIFANKDCSFRAVFATSPPCRNYSLGTAHPQYRAQGLAQSALCWGVLLRTDPQQ
jgi:hypothetical protein